MDLPQKYFAKKEKLVVNNLNFKIGGEAGFGIMASGAIFAKVCTRAGLNIFGYVEYPSLIRGGHNTYQVKVSSEPVFCLQKEVNLLVALNKQTVELHQKDLSDFAGVVFDGDKVTVDQKDFSKPTIKLFSVPLEKIAIQVSGEKLAANTVALGASFALCGLDQKFLNSALLDTFGQKSQKTADLNIKAADAGWQFALKNYASQFSFKLTKLDRQPRMFLTGNDAVSLGAIASGCKLYVAYPMTPASSILHFLAANQIEADMVVKHAADEIEAINMAIGASFAGVRSQVGTSGGGFALMAEAYGLAAMTETPLVIIEVQRPGPATGLPTWTAQGDLHFVLSAGQDDFPRIIIAPGDAPEAFYQTFQAHNLAWRYQTPVLILSDKYLAESAQSTGLFNLANLKIDDGEMTGEDQLKNGYKRYEITQSGISPRAIPGQKNRQFIANSDEHDEMGFSTEDPKTRSEMVKKRMRKLTTLAKNLPPPTLYGPPEAPITLVGWGSTKGPILEAQSQLKREGINTNFLHLVYLNPFPADYVAAVLKNAQKTLICENNSTGQMAQLIRQKTGVEIPHQFLKFDGRPFYPEEIVDFVKERRW